MIDLNIENELRQDLGKSEKLLWAGKPKEGILFRVTDIFLIPFSLLWFGFAIFWEFNALKMGINFFALFGIPFLLVGLYVSVGRFFADSLKRKNTLYGITDNRIIIKSGVFSKETKSLNIKVLADLSIKEKRDGTGTITLGPNDIRYAMFNGMGNWPGAKQPPSIEAVEDVRKVYNIILEQQGKN